MEEEARCVHSGGNSTNYPSTINAAVSFFTCVHEQFLNLSTTFMFFTLSYDHLIFDIHHVLVIQKIHDRIMGRYVVLNFINSVGCKALFIQEHYRYFTLSLTVVFDQTAF